MMPEIVKRQSFKSRDDWRAWLAPRGRLLSNEVFWRLLP